MARTREELEDRVEELERLLGLRDSFDLPGSFEWRGPKIHRLIGVLVRASPRILTKGYLLETIWGEEDSEPQERCLNVYIYRIRKMGIDVRTEIRRGHWVPKEEAERVLREMKRR